MNNEIKARIINFRRNPIVNKETGEVKNTFYVTFAVDVDDYDGFYGREILGSSCSENAFTKLQSCLDKEVKITISERKVFGKNNQYLKYVSKIDGFDVRKF